MVPSIVYFTIIYKYLKLVYLFFHIGYFIWYNLYHINHIKLWGNEARSSWVNSGQCKTFIIHWNIKQRKIQELRYLTILNDIKWGFSEIWGSWVNFFTVQNLQENCVILCVPYNRVHIIWTIWYGPYNQVLMIEFEVHTKWH